MRSLWSSLPALMLAATVAVAQRPPANPVPPTVDPRLEAVLDYWEKSMLNVQSLSAEVKRTQLDKTFQRTTVFEGEAQFLRGGSGQAGPRRGSDASPDPQAWSAGAARTGSAGSAT